MAHFALIENGFVKDVIVVLNSDIQNKEFPESEKIGQEYIKNIGIEGLFLQTSYNNNFRKRYAIINGTYNKDLDAFFEPKPYPSWYINSDLNWEAPVPHPNDGNDYVWNENIKNWELAFPIDGQSKPF